MLQKITLSVYKSIPIPNTSRYTIDPDVILEHSVWAWVENGFALHKIITGVFDESIEFGDKWRITQMKTRRSVSRIDGYDRKKAKEIFCELQHFEYAGLRLADMTHEQARYWYPKYRDRLCRIIFPDTWFVGIG